MTFVATAFLGRRVRNPTSNVRRPGKALERPSLLDDRFTSRSATAVVGCGLWVVGCGNVHRSLVIWCRADCGSGPKGRQQISPGQANRREPIRVALGREANNTVALKGRNKNLFRPFRPSGLTGLVTAHPGRRSRWSLALG